MLSMKHFHTFAFPQFDLVQLSEENIRTRSNNYKLIQHHCHYDLRQESYAIAKMTAQCALHMGALNIFGTPWDSLTTPTALFPTFHGLLFRSTLSMFLQNLKSVALSVPQIIRSTPKIWTVPGYALAPFS